MTTCDICGLTTKDCTCWDDGGKIAVAIYIFADELGQVLAEVDGTEHVEIMRLVGLDWDAVQAERTTAYDPTWLAAKRLFQKTLGVDPDDSDKPWPPEDEVAGYTERMLDAGPDDDPGDLWVGDSMARALKDEEEERRLDNEASWQRIKELETEIDELRADLSKLLAFMLDQQAAGARYEAEKHMGEIGRMFKLQTMISMSQAETKSLPERIEAAFLLGEMVARAQARTYDEDWLDDDEDEFSGGVSESAGCGDSEGGI